jgi:choline dehydrogenase-like flavoprotein
VQRVDLHRLDTMPAAPGSAIHECGTARMGTSPATSVLDPNNQCWDAQGLYVTDAASFPSQGLQNPTLTILALTARACDHVTRVSQRDGNRAA